MLSKMRFLAVLACALILQGCSVVWAVTCPTGVDYKLPTGTQRAFVVNRLGAPVDKRKDSSGRELETHKFKDGIPFGWNLLRGVSYGVGDLFTLGLWEIVGSPMEIVIQKSCVDEMVAEVRYDANSQLDQIRVVAGDGVLVHDTTAPLAPAKPKDVAEPTQGAREVTSVGFPDK